jgi:hypothetical protein
MRGVEGKTGKHRLGFSYALLALTLLIYLGSWAYSAYAAEWRAKSETPRVNPVLKIIKGLRQYQKNKVTFPASFNEVEAQVWKHPNPPAYGASGRTVTVQNYYYYYTFINPMRCSLWMIPVGPHIEESNSYFLILTPDNRRKWKGPALNLTEAAAISGTPTYAQLAMLGMIEQEPLPQKKR